MDTRILGGFYVTIVQSIFIFGLETYIVTPYIRNMFGGFHHRVARRLSGNFPRRQAHGTGEYPHLGGEMRAAGLEDISAYVSRYQNTVAYYIATCPILDLFLEVKRRSG